MVKENQGKYNDALVQAKREFAKRSFVKILEFSGAEQKGESELLILYGGRQYRVKHPNGELSVVDALGERSTADANVQLSDQILIFQYLAEVSGVKPSGKWISFLELPGGPHHYAPFKLEAIEPLAQRFGSAPSEFELTCENLGGTQLAMGDKAFAIPVFPRLNLAFLLWFADEEYPARANILFDATACLHLNTAGLYVLGINAAERIIKNI